MVINYEICIAGLSEISKKKFFKFIENIYSLRLATYIPRYDKDKNYLQISFEDNMGYLTRTPMASYNIPNFLSKEIDINYIPIGELT